MAGLTVPLRLGIDTDCLIYAFDEAATARGLLVTSLCLRLGSRVAASRVAFAELLVGRLKSGGEAAGEELTRVLPGLSWLTFIDIDAPVAVEAARIRAATGLKLPDAVNIAAAKVAGAEAYLTNDRRQQRDGAGLPVLVLDDLVTR